MVEPGRALVALVDVRPLLDGSAARPPSSCAEARSTRRHDPRRLVRVLALEPLELVYLVPNEFTADELGFAWNDPDAAPPAARAGQPGRAPDPLDPDRSNPSLEELVSRCAPLTGAPGRLTAARTGARPHGPHRPSVPAHRGHRSVGCPLTSRGRVAIPDLPSDAALGRPAVPRRRPDGRHPGPACRPRVVADGPQVRPTPDRAPGPSSPAHPRSFDQPSRRQRRDQACGDPASAPPCRCRGRCSGPAGVPRPPRLDARARCTRTSPPTRRASTTRPRGRVTVAFHARADDRWPVGGKPPARWRPAASPGAERPGRRSLATRRRPRRIRPLRRRCRRTSTAAPRRVCESRSSLMVPTPRLPAGPAALDPPRSREDVSLVVGRGSAPRPGGAGMRREVFGFLPYWEARRRRHAVDFLNSPVATSPSAAMPGQPGEAEHDGS